MQAEKASTSRGRLGGAVLAALVGFIALAVYFLAFFFHPPAIGEALEFPDRSEAVAAAVDEAGPSWPGMRVLTRDETSERVLVERRWLFLWEARIEVYKEESGNWQVGYAVALGPGRWVLRILILYIPPAIVAAWVFSRWVKLRQKRVSRLINGFAAAALLGGLVALARIVGTVAHFV